MCVGARKTRRCLPFDTAMRMPPAWSTRVAACRRNRWEGVMQSCKEWRDKIIKTMKPKNREIEICHPVVQGFTGSHSSSDVYRSVNRQALTLKIRVWTQVVAYKKVNGGMKFKKLVCIKKKR